MEINFKSEKGAAIVLVAILVTGIVMLVCAVAIENLQKSTELQGVQKKSLDNLYIAEEGAEYGLYVNREKKKSWLDLNRPFDVSIWEGSRDYTGNKYDSQALEQLSQPTEGRNLVITSQSNQNQNANTQKTVFTNLPNKYFDQVPLWNIREGCDDTNNQCTPTYDNNNMVEGKVYQVVVPNAAFEKSGWVDTDLEYRLVFKCGSSQFWAGTTSDNQLGPDCRVRNVKLKIGGCNTAVCGANGFEGCTKTILVDFPSDNTDQTQMEGKILPTEWFEIVDPVTQEKISLTNEKIVVEFELLSGTMEEISYPANNSGEIRMCKLPDVVGNWDGFADIQGGLSSMEVRKHSEYKDLATDKFCCAWECTAHEQICNVDGYDCSEYGPRPCTGYDPRPCTGYRYYCPNYPYYDFYCNSQTVGWSCYSDGCNSYGTCAQECNQWGDAPCNQWGDAPCIGGWVCNRFHEGPTCVTWGACKSWCSNPPPPGVKVE